MKFFVAAILAVLIIGLTSAVNINDDGQPGCKEAIELEVVNYRNLWDPTRYWSCKQRGVAAVSVRCPDEHAWLDSQKKCVEWIDWNWEELVAPPSKP
ncbi:uncharacterized protein LOC129917236 [Episyrphus balteatus]|uniref:uncharacterized protein LOC129917236 n=1 Tax=Episyrphus balteatus TaxID=286459 RepID=UPI0024850719|nr:uncharacterized protein LOC129917236 [Episyrphus balteatus]